MGVVYKGRDPFIDRLVALKTITTNQASNTDYLDRFKREAKAAGNLQHPNIVTIFELGQDDTGTLYIAMEFLEGHDLAHAITQETSGQVPLPVSLKIGYMVQVCRALDYAHRRNVVHRDIKPGNIFITTDGTVKVVDFGIARLTDTSATSSGMLIGTIDSMSPEQIRGEKVDGRTDIWAVGVMLYEALTYQKPFLGSNITAVMFSIVSQEPKPLRELRPDLPPELETILKKIFRKDVNERYQTMEELLQDLEPLYRKMQQETVGTLVSQSEMLARAGDLLRARDLLKQVLQLDTGHTHARTLMDRISAEIRKKEVIPRLNQFVVSGKKLMEEGKFDEARKEVEGALKVDSSFQPARELLAEVQKAAERSQAIQAGLRETRQRLAEGALTDAEQHVTQVLSIAPEDPQAQSLLRQIREEKDRRHKRKILTEGLQNARQLWTGQSFDEAMAVLTSLQVQFPKEEEISKLLDAVRTDAAQQEVQQKLGEARKHLGAQAFSEALAILDALLAKHPQESAPQKLREVVLQERREHARRLQLQREMQSLKKLVSQENYDEAIHAGEQILKEFPDEFEITRLVEYAQSQKAQHEQLRRRLARLQELQELIQSHSLEKAAAACEESLKEFPGDADILRLLDLARTQQKEQKEKERKDLLDQRLRNIRQSIERGDLTDAIDLGKRTMVQVGADTDLTKLVQMAEHERMSREEKKDHNEQVQSAITMLESKKFDDATRVLRAVDQTGVFDPRVPFLLRAAEENRVPTREDMTLVLGRSPAAGKEAPGAAPPPSAAVPSTGEDFEKTQKLQPARGGPPPSAPDTGVAGEHGASTTVEETQVWTKGKPAPPAPVPQEAGVSSATSVMSPGALEDTAKWAAPPAAGTTVQPHPEMSATSVMPASAVTAPMSPPQRPAPSVPAQSHPEMSATSVMPASAVTAPMPPPVRQAPAAPPHDATTIAPPPKEDKEKDKKSKRAWKKEEKQRAPSSPPLEQTTEPQLGASVVIPASRVDEALRQPPSSATSIAPPPTGPRVDEQREQERRERERKDQEKKDRERKDREVREADQRQREQRERERREQAEPSSAEAAAGVQPAPPFWRSGVGLALGGVVIAAVIGFGIYKVMSKPPTPDSGTSGGTGGSGTVIAEPPPPIGTGGDTIGTPLPIAPSPIDEARKHIAAAQKMAGKGDFNGALGELGKAKVIVSDNHLTGELPKRISDSEKKYNEAMNNKSLADLLARESVLWEDAKSNMDRNQFDAAEVALKQIANLGEGGVHKAEAQTELNRIPVYRQEESQFPAAQAQAQKALTDRSSRSSAVQALNQVATLHGRRETQARQLLDHLAAAQARETQEIASLKSGISSDISAKNFDAAKQKAGELERRGEDVSNVRAQISQAENASRQPAKETPVQVAARSATCKVNQVARAKYDRPVQAGSPVGQKFLDKEMEIPGGQNCGLPPDALASLPVDTALALNVDIDEHGNVIGGKSYSADARTVQTIMQYAKGWKFAPPTVNGTAVKTTVSITVTVASR
jgi:serine/threonine protein kinase